MNFRKSSWSRLVTVAQLAPADARDAAAPNGFSTRVAALAFAAGEPSISSLFARLSWRALGVAALVMLASVAANFKPMINSLDRDTGVALADPVGEWLDIS